jgi:hypothetical protein
MATTTVINRVSALVQLLNQRPLLPTKISSKT